ncbi:MAG: hypothetical protein DDT26_01763 [Dehalococcoidia bacterium]|nr:hypothetical protein [Chloroflexota bacterium]
MRKNERGFSLIEVLVALALLGIVAAAFLMALSTASRALFVADERATAESLARSQMEYVKMQGYKTDFPDRVATYDRITGIPAGYSIWSVDRTGGRVEAITATDSIIGVPWNPHANPPAVTDDKGLQRIKLIIKHHGREVITLEGFKVKR